MTVTAKSHPDINQVMQTNALLHEQIRRLTNELAQATIAVEVLAHELDTKDQKFRRLVEESQDGIVLTDEAGLIIEWNRAQERITGRKRDQVIDQPLWDVFAAQIPEEHEMDFQQFRSQIKDVLASQGGDWTHSNLEVSIVRSDNQTRFLQIGAFLIPTNKGNMLAAINRDVTDNHQFYEALKEDITARKLAEQALSDYNERLEEIIGERTTQLRRLSTRTTAILNNISDSIILVYANGSIDITNRTFEQEFLYAPDELYNHSISEIAVESCRQQLMFAIESVSKDGKNRNIEITARRRDGSLFDAEVAMARVVDKEVHVICSLHDISHLKEVERMKSHFISTVSHELRTPITTLMLSSANLKHYYERMSEERRQTSIENIHLFSKTLADLVDAILDISRVEAKQGKRGNEPFIVGDALRTILLELHPAAEAKGLSLTVQAEQHDLEVIGDHTDMQRIWRNLITNAIKYTPAGGQIAIRLGMLEIVSPGRANVSSPLETSEIAALKTLHPGQYVVGQVADTGHGISPEDLQQLFTRFFRGWASQSAIPGTGLGLSLIKEMLTLYGGDIHVNSQVNHGSTFTFWLPFNHPSSY